MNRKIDKVFTAKDPAHEESVGLDGNRAWVVLRGSHGVVDKTALKAKIARISLKLRKYVVEFKMKKH